MQRNAAEREVDRTIEKWWLTTRKMDRALWLLVPVLIFLLWAGDEWGPSVKYIPLTFPL
jgi:hypothetical protein